jgi:hypothetical protein
MFYVRFNHFRAVKIPVKRVFDPGCHWRSENPVNSASLKTGYGAVIFSSPT